MRGLITHDSMPWSRWNYRKNIKHRRRDLSLTTGFAIAFPITAVLAGVFGHLAGKYFGTRTFIEQIKNGQVTEKWVVGNFANRFAMEAEKEIAKHQDDPIAVKEGRAFVAKVKKARSLDDLLALKPSDPALNASKQAFEKAKAEMRMRSDSLPYHLQKRVSFFLDEGKKGMKKGKHVMARDPEYVKGLSKGATAAISAVPGLGGFSAGLLGGRHTGAAAAGSGAAGAALGALRYGMRGGPKHAVTGAIAGGLGGAATGSVGNLLGRGVRHLVTKEKF